MGENSPSLWHYDVLFSLIFTETEGEIVTMFYIWSESDMMTLIEARHFGGG